MGTTAITLQHKSKLESSIGRNWMYRGSTYRFTDFTEVGEYIIISTDIKALKIKADQVADFLKDCLPAANSDTEKGSELIVMIPGVESNIFSEVAAGLMTSFREIQGSKDPVFLKQATDRARSKVLISKAVTDVAKTVIQAKKLSKQ